MKLVWTRPALADRKAIREYIEQHAPAAALAIDELFSEKTGLLLDHPPWAGPVASLEPASWSRTRITS